MFLGIDTSCYTTSVALVDDKENILLNKKQLLPVPTGEKGLSQSEALFNHLKRLPKLLEEVGQLFCYSDIKCIAASIKPRSINNSYMPVFTIIGNFI
jgi:N6-L-threonylcarbamoyladenine synthase